MKNIAILKIVVFSIVIAVSGMVSAQNQFCKLDIEITGLKSDEGKVAIQLFDENQVVVKQLYTNISEGKSRVSFDSLSPGQYAIRYYHDKDDNGEMDTGLFGIPKEGYGFSNNAKGKYGPPEFKEWLFVLEKDLRMELLTIN